MTDSSDGELALVIKGLGGFVYIAIYDRATGQLRDGVKIEPEKARLIASRITWESMQIEEGKRP